MTKNKALSTSVKVSSGALAFGVILSQSASVYAWDWKLTSAVSCTDKKVVFSVTSPSKELAGTYTLVFTPSTGGSGFTAPMTYDGKTVTGVVSTVSLDKFGNTPTWNVYLNKDNNVKNTFSIDCPAPTPTPTPTPTPASIPTPPTPPIGGGEGQVLSTQSLPDTGPETAGIVGSAGLLGLGAILRGASKFVKKSA